MVVRRGVLRLDTPTRDGDTEMAILTNLATSVADAKMVADLYRRRWTVESLFARVERNLQGELLSLSSVTPEKSRTQFEKLIVEAVRRTRFLVSTFVDRMT